VNGRKCLINFTEEAQTCNDYEIHYSLDNLGIPMDQTKVYLYIKPHEPKTTKVTLGEKIVYYGHDLTLAYINRYELGDCRAEAHFIQDPDCIHYCYPVLNDGECGYQELWSSSDCIDCPNSTCDNNDHYRCPEDCTDCNDGECKWWEKELCIDECRDDASKDNICQEYEIGVDDDCGDEILSDFSENLFLKKDQISQFYDDYQLKVNDIYPVQDYKGNLRAKFLLLEDGRAKESFTMDRSTWKVFDDHLLYFRGQESKNVIEIAHLKIKEIKNPLILSYYEGFMYKDRFHFISVSTDINDRPERDYREYLHGYRHSYQFIMNLDRDDNEKNPYGDDKYILVTDEDTDSITLEFSDEFFTCGNEDGACPAQCSSEIDVDCDECVTNQECDDEDVTTADLCQGTPKQCINEAITECKGGDDYCPDSCGFETDQDCDECDSDGGCLTDGCQVGICNGTPKRCMMTTMDGCSLGSQCVDLGYISNVEYCNGSALVHQKNEGQACAQDFECISSLCKERLCYERRGLEAFFSWIKSLFS